MENTQILQEVLNYSSITVWGLSLTFGVFLLCVWYLSVAKQKDTPIFQVIDFLARTAWNILSTIIPFFRGKKLPYTLKREKAAKRKAKKDAAKAALCDHCRQALEGTGDSQDATKELSNDSR